MLLSIWVIGTILCAIWFFWELHKGEYGWVGSMMAFLVWCGFTIAIAIYGGINVLKGFF